VKLDVIFSQNDIKSKHINTVSHNHTFGLYDLIPFFKKNIVSDSYYQKVLYLADIMIIMDICLWGNYNGNRIQSCSTTRWIL